MDVGRLLVKLRNSRATAHSDDSGHLIGGKAAATVTAADFRGLRKLREAARARFTAGVVLYDGETSLSFGEGLYAVPIRSLWEP